MTKRNRQFKRAENRRKQRQLPASKEAPDYGSIHWLTLSVSERPCDCCGFGNSIAYRHADQSTLCDVCLERLGIVPRESRKWSRAVGSQLNPEAGNEARRAEPESRTSWEVDPAGKVVPLTLSTNVEAEREAA